MAPSRRITGSKLQPTGTLGIVVCPSGQLVRVGIAEGMTKGPPVVEFDPCPACGRPHTHLKPSWRKPTALDEGREVDVVVDAEGRSIA